MLRLYQREECPSCAKVRRYLALQGLSFEAINVPRLGSERAEVLALDGIDEASVPALQDGEKVIQGSDEIIAHLRGDREPSFGDPAYGLTRRLEGMAYSDAIPAVKEALQSEGFGVLTEIDVKATMKKKLDVDFRDYVILGACNAPLAHQALSQEPAIGLLLPCNVVVTSDPSGATVVSVIDPRAMFGVVGSPEVQPLAEEVRNKLASALAKI